jgi:hypothetical protein
MENLGAAAVRQGGVALSNTEGGSGRRRRWCGRREWRSNGGEIVIGCWQGTFEMLKKGVPPKVR